MHYIILSSVCRGRVQSRQCCVLPLQTEDYMLNICTVLPNPLSKARFLALFLSLMDPLPRTEILAPVSSCRRLMVLPCGPRIFPTKLNYIGTGCKGKNGNSTIIAKGFFCAIYRTHHIHKHRDRGVQFGAHVRLSLHTELSH